MKKLQPLNDYQYAIIEVLAIDGKSTFTDFLEKTGHSRPTIARHLRRLLLRKEIRKIKQTAVGVEGAYFITEKGADRFEREEATRKKLLESLYSILDMLIMDEEGTLKKITPELRQRLKEHLKFERLERKKLVEKIERLKKR